MALNTIDSKIRIKRSTVTGATPYIGPSVDHTDGTWGVNDIYPGEFYFNQADNLLWIGGANSGVTEVALSGHSSGGGGDGAYVNNGLNTYTGGTSAFQTVNISAATLDNLSVSGDTSLSATSASTLTILNSGMTVNALTDWSSNLIDTGVTNSTIAAGSGNTINQNLRNVFVAGKDITATSNDTAYFSNIVLGTKELKSQMNLSFAVSDEITAITTGTDKLTIYAPYAFTLTEVRASLSTSGSTSSQFDINVNGSTILSTKLTIDASEPTSATAAVPPVISTAAIADNDKITIDIDTAGTAATGAKIYLIGY